MTVAALVATLILLGCLSAMQILLIAGMPIGNYAWGGKDRVLSPRMRIASAAAILIYAAFAALLASRAGILPAGQSAPVIIGTWALLAYSALSILVNLASRSPHERNLQTPVSIALTLGILIIALGPVT